MVKVIINKCSNLNYEDVIGFEALYGGYVATMCRLHEDFTIDQEDFKALLENENEVLVFILDHGQVVSTAQASLAMTPPQWHFYVNNVVTRSGYGGKGYGRLAIAELVDEVRRHWGKRRTYTGVLTNAPSKGNSGFYEATGWRYRGPDSECPTVVWEKHI